MSSTWRCLCFPSRNTGSSGMVHIFLSLPSRYSSSLCRRLCPRSRTCLIHVDDSGIRDQVRMHTVKDSSQIIFSTSDQPVDMLCLLIGMPLRMQSCFIRYSFYWEYTPVCSSLVFILLYILMDDMALNIVASFQSRYPFRPAHYAGSVG